MSGEQVRLIWFLEAAEGDIAVAFEWYESQRAGLGAEFIAEIDEALQLVLDFPESCEVFYRETRRCLIERFPFEVFYRLQDGILIVVACMHGAQDPATVLNRIGG